jgi:hypothetical protein
MAWSVKKDPKDSSWAIAHLHSQAKLQNGFFIAQGKKSCSTSGELFSPGTRACLLHRLQQLILSWNETCLIGVRGLLLVQKKKMSFVTMPMRKISLGYLFFLSCPNLS